MKNLLALLLFFSCGATAQTNLCNQKKYAVEILDFDYSMANTTRYYFFDDSLTITSIGGIEGERDSCLVAKKVTEEQREKIHNFLSSLNMGNLKDKYEKPYVEDGDRKMVRICFRDKIKTIEINNIYQKDMANLYEVVNQIIDAKFRIHYKTETH